MLRKQQQPHQKCFNLNGKTFVCAGLCENFIVCAANLIWKRQHLHRKIIEHIQALSFISNICEQGYREIVLCFSHRSYTRSNGFGESFGSQPSFQFHGELWKLPMVRRPTVFMGFTQCRTL